ncbi:SapC family protein [Sphingomonas sp.]|uniref:SapC family protein n=1 Tax=Sphingomonas sp. TaxID=28214 RepID=UPI002D0424BE|nr:SapC family protein [Sphingomonas sp.]HTG37436.1 SapC family protein [Sphingomonas sp.]
MTRIRPLDAGAHRDLRFDLLRGAAERRLAQIGLSEIALAAADMPLCLAKDGATGRFNLIALMGLVEPANLFWQGGACVATYVPRAAMLGGFRIDPAGWDGLAIDEDDAAFGSAGTPIFEGDALAASVAGASEALARLVEDIAVARSTVDAYAALRLIRPLRVTLTFRGGREHLIDGLYTIAGAPLAALDDAAVLRLHREDRLALSAILAASLAQVERLRQLHNAAGFAPIDTIALSVAD